MPLLALGTHVFEIAPLNFQQLVRETTVKLPAIARFGQRPSRQHTGFGEDPITISGLLYPDELGGRAEFAAIRATQQRAQPVTMMGWSEDDAIAADIWGKVVILSVRDTQTYINSFGHGRKLSFEIELAPAEDMFGVGRLI